MADYISQITLPDNHEYDIKAKSLSPRTASNVLTGTGTVGSYTNNTYYPAKWTFNTGSQPNDGDIVTIKIPVAGHDYGVFMSVDNGSHYYPVVLNGTEKITTHYPINTYITVIFEPTGSAASMYALAGQTSSTRTTVTGGVWRVLNYRDTNSNDTGYYHRRIYPNLKASGTIHPYSIIMQLPNGRWSGITTTAPNNPGKSNVSPVATGKTANASGFMLGHVLLMYANTTYADANNIGTYNIWSAHTGLIDARYSFNLANSTGNGFVAYTPVYIVGTVSDGLFHLDTTKWWTQTLPSSDDGKVYIYIGDAYDWYRLTFTEDKPIYWYKNGAIRLYSGASEYALSAPLSGISGADDLKAIEAISDTSGLLKKTAANTWTLDTNNYVTSSGITSITIGATSPVQSSTSTAQTGSSASTTISLKDAYGDTKNPYGAKAKNLVLAGPASGSNAVPTFRALVAADIPDISETYVKKVTSTDNAIVRFDGTSGQIQNSGIIIDDNNRIIIGATHAIYQNQANTSNYTAPIGWRKGNTGWYKDDNTTLYAYQPQIGQHNTGGDGTGSITILPYPTDNAPWGGSVGLFICKGQMSLDNNRIPHTGNTTGSVGGTTTPVYVEAGVIKAGTALGTASQKAESYFVKAITSTDNAITRFDGTSGQIQDSKAILDDSGNLLIANDASIKIYRQTNTTYGYETYAIQTCFDGTDPETSTYTSTYESRCNLLLQPRGGQVYIGTDLTTTGDTNYSLYVTGNTYLKNTLVVKDIIPDATDTYSLGTASKRWNAYFAPKAIGGRNYIYSTPITGSRSTIEGKTVVFNPNANNGDSYFYVKAARDIPVGTYTFSMDCEGLGADEVWRFGIISQNSGNVILAKNGRSALTFEVTTAITAGTKIIIDDSSSRPTTSTRVVFSNFMWEAATSPSDFSYAPEEIESTYAKKITSTKYGIAYYSDTDGTFAGTGAGTSGQYLKSNGNSAPTWATFSASTVGLGNVENTKLSTWAGSSNITTVGTISTGTWHGTKIANDYIANPKVTIAGHDVNLGGSLTAATLTSSLGLSNALHFIGITSTELADESTTATLTPKSTNSLSKTTGFVDGDIVMDGDQLREYVWSGSAWHLLGITTSTKYEKTTSGNTFISKVTQATDGTITAESRELNTSGEWSGNAATATTLTCPSLTTEANIESGTRSYQGSGGTWTGSISSMAYAGILQVCGGYGRGWQIWATRGNNASQSLHWRNSNGAANAWNEERIILDSGNYTDYTVTKTGTGASGTWGISITGTAAKATADASGNTITSTYATKTEIEGLLAAADAMIFKGVINAPTDLPDSHSAGDTYRVGAEGTYPIVDSNGRYCEEGTLIICIANGTAANPAHWTAVETNEDGAVIGPASSKGNNIVTFSGNTGRIIQDSGKAFSTATPGSSSTDVQIPTAKAVWAAINALDANLNNTTPGAGKTLTAFSQTNGKVSATFGDISITKSQVSDFAHDHDAAYLKLNGSNNMTADVNIIAGDTDKFVNFWYNTNKTAGGSWRIGELGSGSSDANYFVIQSGTSDSSKTAWNDTIQIGANTFNVYLPSTTASTSTSTGALKVAGGVGVAGQVTATRLAANGSNTSYNLYVNGTSYFKGNVTHDGIVYFKNDQSYYINKNAQGYLDKLQAGNIRLTENKVEFYTANTDVSQTSNGNSLCGDISATAAANTSAPAIMSFNIVQGASLVNSNFSFNGDIIPQSNATYNLGSISLHWKTAYINNTILVSAKAQSISSYNDSSELSYISPGLISVNINGTISQNGSGYYLINAGKQYARLYIQTIGQINNVGQSILELGNNVGAGTANNSYGTLHLYNTDTTSAKYTATGWTGSGISNFTILGATSTTQNAAAWSTLILGNDKNVATTDPHSQGLIRIYSKGTVYTDIQSQVATSGSHTVYLPKYGNDMYLAHVGDNNAVGSGTQPVYVAADGRITASTNTVGDAYTPVYSNAGVLTATAPVQYNEFTIVSADTQVDLNNDAYTADTYVLTIVITSGEANINAPITWTSSTGKVRLSTTVAVSGNVSGYILTARGTSLVT